MQVVVFKLADEQFAVETAKVQSINDTMGITKVPKAPEHIKGLINLRGNIISLLDINLLLDVEKNNSEQNNIIILEMEDELVGITEGKKWQKYYRKAKLMLSCLPYPLVN